MEGRFDAIMAHWRVVTKGLVKAVREGGGQLYVWTVDDAKMIEKLTAMGVDGIITNDPEAVQPMMQVAAEKPAGPLRRGSCARRSSGGSPLKHASCRGATGIRRRPAVSTPACPPPASAGSCRRPGATRRRLPTPRTRAAALRRGSTHCLVAFMVLQAEAHVHLIAVVPSPGIEPRMPSVSG